MALHVVIGPPAAGKSTYVRERAHPGDIRIDYDDLANLLAGLTPDNHEHTDPVKTVTKAARRAALDAAVKVSNQVDVWLIHSSPAASTLEKYRQMGAEIHTIDPGKDVVMSRAKAQRPAHMLKVAALWYDEQKPKQPAPPKRTKTTTERGYGWQHQQDRERLMRRHRNGQLCWWCGLPMHGDRTKTKNWDGRALAADHSDESARAGGKADRLLHGTCNSQRQDGSNDHIRPAVTGRHPSEPLPTGRTSEPAAPTLGFNFGGVSFA